MGAQELNHIVGSRLGQLRREFNLNFSYAARRIPKRSNPLEQLAELMRYRITAIHGHPHIRACTQKSGHIMFFSDCLPDDEGSGIRMDSRGVATYFSLIDGDMSRLDIAEQHVYGREEEMREDGSEAVNRILLLDESTDHGLSKGIGERVILQRSEYQNEFGWGSTSYYDDDGRLLLADVDVVFHVPRPYGSELPAAASGNKEGHPSLDMAFVPQHGDLVLQNEPLISYVYSKDNKPRPLKPEEKEGLKFDYPTTVKLGQDRRFPIAFRLVEQDLLRLVPEKLAPAAAAQQVEGHLVNGLNGR